MWLGQATYQELVDKQVTHFETIRYFTSDLACFVGL